MWRDEAAAWRDEARRDAAWRGVTRQWQGEAWRGVATCDEAWRGEAQAVPADRRAIIGQARPVGGNSFRPFGDRSGYLPLAGEAWTPPESYPLPQLVPLNEVLPYAGFPLAGEIIHAPPPLSRTGLPLSRDVIVGFCLF